MQQRLISIKMKIFMLLLFILSITIYASGSVNLYFPRNLGYKVNYETVSGDLNLHNRELSF